MLTSSLLFMHTHMSVRMCVRVHLLKAAEFQAKSPTRNIRRANCFFFLFFKFFSFIFCCSYISFFIGCFCGPLCWWLATFSCLVLLLLLLLLLLSFYTLSHWKEVCSTWELLLLLCTQHCTRTKPRLQLPFSFHWYIFIYIYISHIGICWSTCQTNLVFAMRRPKALHFVLSLFLPHVLVRIPHMCVCVQLMWPHICVNWQIKRWKQLRQS